MINNYINDYLQNYNIKTLNDFENAIREISQVLILCGLSKTDFFKKAVFYGGTCLRIFHGLGRYSEDLDFTVLRDDANFNFDDYTHSCVKLLESFGLKCEVYSKNDYDIGEIRRRYFKIPIYDIACSYFNTDSINKERKVAIKTEVSTFYVEGATYENNMISSPVFARVLCYDYSSLFAGKICAILNRDWRNRVKGRDYYDYMHYVCHNVPINLEYINSKANSSTSKKMDFEELKLRLKEKFNEVDFDSVKKDIMPFADDLALDGLDKDLFIASVDNLKCLKK